MLTIIVQDNSQNGDAIPVRNPVYTPRDREQKGAIANNLADKLTVTLGFGGELNAQGGAARPAETTATAVDP